MRFLLVLFLVFCLKQDGVVSYYFWVDWELINYIGTHEFEMDSEPMFLDEHVYKLTEAYDVAMQFTTGEYKRVYDHCDEKRIEYLNKADILLEGLSILYNKRVQIEKDDYYKLAEDIKNNYDHMVEITPEYTSGIMYCIDKCALKVSYKAKSIDQNLIDICERGFRRFHLHFNSGAYEQYMPYHHKDLKKKVEKLETTYKFAVEMLPRIAEENQICLDRFSTCKSYETR